MLRWPALLACLALAGSAAAQELEIAPTRVALDVAPGHASVWLHNTSAHRWQGHAQLYLWDQREAGELLLAADDLVLSPATLDIAPGQRQRLRLVRPGAAPATERAYRLLLSPAAGSGAQAIRYSLPVFSRGSGPDLPDAPPLRAQPVAAAEAAGVDLLLHNDGERGVQLADLVYIDGHGNRQVLIDGLAGYVLAHRQRRWPLPPRRDRYADGQFHARIDGAGSAALPGPLPSVAAAAPTGL